MKNSFINKLFKYKISYRKYLLHKTNIVIFLLFTFSLPLSAFAFHANLRQEIPKKSVEPISKKRLIINYHPNGKIKEKGYQGYYVGKGIATGTYIGSWTYYDRNGKLVQTIDYHNDIPSKAYIQKKLYYPNGKIKSIELFNNYELYQSEIDSIGTWQYFNPQGKLIKKIVH